MQLGVTRSSFIVPSKFFKRHMLWTASIISVVYTHMKSWGLIIGHTETRV